MKKVLFLALAAVLFSFTACDSKKENAQEAAGEKVTAAGEVKADAMENAANVVRDSAEAKGDAMKDAANKMDAPDASTKTTTTTTEEVK